MCSLFAIDAILVDLIKTHAVIEVAIPYLQYAKTNDEIVS